MEWVTYFIHRLTKDTLTFVTLYRFDQGNLDQVPDEEMTLSTPSQHCGTVPYNGPVRNPYKANINQKLLHKIQQTA